MKKVFLALAAVVALAACSKEETLVQQAPEAIGFDTFVDNATRSVNDPSFTTSNLTDFAVYGYVEDATLFDGVTVNKAFTNAELTKTEWKYEHTQYWIDGAKYKFSAVAPVTNAKWTKAAADKNSVSLSFSNTDGKQDLVYAEFTHTATASSNPLVALNFRHTLSKVKFSFENAYSAEGTTIQVRNIQVTNAYTSGKVTLTGTTDWDVTDAPKNTFNFGAATDDETTPEKENKDLTQNSLAAAYGMGTYESQEELLLIPADYDSAKAVEANRLAVKFTYDIVVNGILVKSFDVTPKVSIKLLPGYAYDFKATIKPGEPIEFTATVSGWDEDLNDDNIQNDEIPME